METSKELNLDNIKSLDRFYMPREECAKRESRISSLETGVNELVKTQKSHTKSLKSAKNERKAILKAVNRLNDREANFLASRILSDFYESNKKKIWGSIFSLIVIAGGALVKVFIG